MLPRTLQITAGAQRPEANVVERLVVLLYAWC